MMRFALYSRGIRTSITNNSTAYGYSILITGSLAALNTLVGAPSISALFLFVLGAAGAFAVLEMLASKFFTVRIRGEPSDVVVLGSAFNVVSISLGLAAATLTGSLLTSWVAWILGPFCATAVYILGAGFEFSVARQAEEGREEEDETEDESEDA